MNNQISNLILKRADRCVSTYHAISVSRDLSKPVNKNTKSVIGPTKSFYRFYCLVNMPLNTVS